jgi:hypothetical protein
VGPTDTIQAAVTAANDGDTIAVVTDTVHYETVVIANKAITISGGWAPGCAFQSNVYGSILDAQGNGRALTIIGAPAAAKTVIIDNMHILNGDATDLGGAPLITTTVAAAVGAVPPQRAQAANVALQGGPAAPPADWKAVLADLNRHGHFPGDQENYDALVNRVDSLLQRADELAAQPRRPASAPAVPGQADCGGGIFTYGEALVLHNVLLQSHIASQTGIGYGGALCAVHLPPAGVVIDEGTQVSFAIGSTAADGRGGAAFIDGGDTAAVSLAGETFLYHNVASEGGAGYGGALAIMNSPQVDIEETTFMWNLGGRGISGDAQHPSTSLGGGLYLENCPGARVAQSSIIDNMADAGGDEGVGGGIFATFSPDLVLVGNTVLRNTAQANVGLLGPSGFGGGVALSNSANATIDSNTFSLNAGSLYAQGYGGGLYAFQSEGAAVTNNKFADNAAAFFGNGAYFGGGIFFVKSDSASIGGNQFLRNMLGLYSPADFLGFGPGGGGIGIDSSKVVTIENNAFNSNTALMAGGIGHGAGIDVGGTASDVMIRNNTFDKNVSVRAASTVGGNNAGEGAGVTISDARFINVYHNIFRNNAGTLVGYPGSVVMSSGFIAGSDENGADHITIDSNLILDSGRGLDAQTIYAAGGIRVSQTDYFTITNNAIANGTAYGAEVYYHYLDADNFTRGQIVNNTLDNNGDYGLGLGGDWDNDAITVANNIITQHDNGIATDSRFPTKVDNNLFFGNTLNMTGTVTSTTSIIGDPQFVDANAENFRLQRSSPARDAGVGIPPAPAVDADSVTRPFGPAVDIGAHEWRGWLRYLPFAVRQQ